MVEHVPFIVPTYHGLRQSRGFLYSGMLAYRLLTLGTQTGLTDPATQIPRDQALSRAQTRRKHYGWAGTVRGADE